ncbi:MAG: calcium/sodium antiporter [Lachnospiraceae bacterium]|nr:calcium/sodium antiporter [Lachnospiraceae bacterium]
MVIPVLLFILGLILLIKGGDWFVDGAAGIAAKFHVPDLLIGATVVSVGTTLPEVMVSANSALSGHGEIAYGNAIGSIICNTALIAALTVAVKPSAVDRRALITPVSFFFAAAAFYMTISYATGDFTRTTGAILLIMFLVYTTITVREAFSQNSAKGTKAAVQKKEAEEVAGNEEPVNMGKLVFLLILGAALIAVGADLLVDNGTLIAQGLGVPESVIALTFVALGTSLPELVTAITSLIKGHGALSLGNICGANLFNLVLVSGTAILLGPFRVPAEKTVMIGGKEIIASLIIDIPLMLLVMLILTVPALIRGRLSRIQGIILLAIYFGFTLFQLFG